MTTQSEPSDTTTDRIMLGVTLMMGFCLTAPLLDVTAKLASDIIPVGQITTARFLVQVALMLPFCLAMGLSFRMNGRFGMLALRAVLLVLSTFFFISAIKVMPLADALAIVFIEPFIVMLVGKYGFGEDVGPRRIAAAGIGFLGVVLVIQPSFATFGAVALYPLGTAVCFAGYVLLTRGLRGRLHPVMTQFYTGAIASLICLPVIWIANGTVFAMLDPVWPQGIYWVWLFGVGFFATISHMMMTYGLTLAPSSTLAPMQYFEIPVATMLGLIVFAEFPNLIALGGIALIMGAGLYMIHRERVTSRIKTQLHAPI
ncbi:MAG: drug/metabolite transporter (DMT)-like permease [Octadecabacter sp.]|jgi:drug/metabolite transporter (DMT)-like permease